MSFEHIVLFRLRDGADPDEVVDVLDRSRPDDPGLVSWTVARSLDERKGVVVVERAVFVDRDAFERFRGSDAHREAGRHLAGCADWLVADVEDAGRS
jgi:hypothetical protein